MSAARGFSWLRAGRIPALDGIRAVSIALVLSAHAIGTGPLPMNARVAGFAGDLGVRSFFVLSGFLITTLLLRESERTGTISLWSFYLRRTFRIFPAFYIYVVVLFGLAMLGALRLQDNDLLAAASYTTNFHSERSWWTGHLWSLAVEEQFYVVWPLALVALGLVRAWWFAAAAIVAAPIVRLALWQLVPPARGLVDQAFPCVFDALATGCLLAFAAPRLGCSQRWMRLLDARWFWPAVVLALATLTISNPFVRYGGAMTIGNFAIAAVILRCVAQPQSRASRVLERPGFVWLGTLSYSLYLWQQLFLDRHSSQWLHQFPINIALALVCATACHYLIERPCLQLGARLRPRARAQPVLGSPMEILDVSVARELRASSQSETAAASASRGTSPRETLA